jgi:hypothetical protein
MELVGEGKEEGIAIAQSKIMVNKYMVFDLNKY